MEITAKIVKQNDVVGVRLQDGALSYPIVLEALAKREIFNSLKTSGWNLVGLPLKFSKQGVSIDALPEEAFEALPFDERADFFSYDETDILTDEELAKALPQEKEYIPWRSPIYAHITTRAQFLEFLKSSKNLSFSSSIPESYCPLNSFCSPEAMFTPEEYFDPRNAEYVDIIESRRRLNFEAYQELISLFHGLGLPESYTAFDFQKFYFSWGICGINAKKIGEKVEDRVIAFGAKYASDSISYQNAHITKDVFLDSEGNVIPALQPGWHVQSKQGATGLEPNELMCVSAYKTVADRVCVLTCDDLRVTFNDYRLNYSLLSTGQAKWLSVVQVRYPLSYNYISVGNYNILSEEGKLHIYNQLITNALSRELVDKLKVSSDASSLKALKAVGFTERAAISYIAHRLSKLTVTSGSEDGAAIDNEESQKLEVVKAGLSDYLSGADDLDETARGSLGIFDNDAAPNIADVEEFVNDVRSGQINIDEILAGQNSDTSASRDLYSQVFAALLNNNLISAKNLVQQVTAFSLGDEYAGYLRIITDNNHVVKIPVSKGDLQFSSYKLDLLNYQERMADEALAWIHVNKVYCEPTTGDRARHVAVEIYRFDHANIGQRGLSLANSAIIIPLTEMVERLITNLPNAMVRRRAQRFINTYVAHAIFTAYSTGRLDVKMPESLGNQILYISEDLFAKINKAIYKQYDSTFAISDHMDFEGEFGYYCGNATIFPDLVLPLQNTLLFVYPFMENWENLRSKPEQLAAYRNRGLLPSANEEPNFTGISNCYRSNHAVDHADCEAVRALRATGVYMREDDATQYSPWSLKVYADRVKKEIAERQESKTVQLTNLPMLHEDCFPVSYPSSEPDTCTPAEFNSDIIAKVKHPIVRKSVLEKWPELLEMTEAHIHTNVAGDQEGFIEVTALPSTIFSSSMADGIIDLPHRLSEKRVKLALRYGDALMFTDKTKIMAKDLPSLDSAVYAYEQVGDHLFLMDSDGCILTRVVPEGVVF